MTRYDAVVVGNMMLLLADMIEEKIDRVAKFAPKHTQDEFVFIGGVADALCFPDPETSPELYKTCTFAVEDETIQELRTALARLRDAGLSIAYHEGPSE